MRGSWWSLTLVLAVFVLVGASCAPAAATPVPTASPSAQPSAMATGSQGAVPSAELVTTAMPLQQSISIGIPRDWVVLRRETAFELDQQLRPNAPELADLYSFAAQEGLAAVAIDALPEALSSVHANYFCNATPDPNDRLRLLRTYAGAAATDATVVELPAGDVARISFAREVGSYRLNWALYAWSAPTTDCDGTLEVTVVESVPDPGLADAIAQSVMLGGRQGIVTLELEEAITLPPVDFPVVCQLGGDRGTELRMSSGTAVESMTLDLAVDSAGQPVFFQFANGTLMYFSGKGFEAREVFVPEPGSTQRRGTARFEGITPPDDPAHELSGRVAWECV